MTDSRRKSAVGIASEFYRTFVGLFGAALAAFAAVVVGAAPAAAATMEDLMDACVQVLEDGNFAGVAPYGVLRLEEGIMGSTHRIDAGTVTLYVQSRIDDDTIHACNVLGYTWGDKATIPTSGVSWGVAEDQIEAWFAARAKQPGNADLSRVSIGDPYIITVCNGPGEGFLITGGPAYIGSEANDIPERDWPFVFSASRVADPEQACEFYKKYGPGG